MLLDDKKVLQIVQAEFRATRNTLLSKLDIEINIAVDAGLDVDELRKHRQALRDSTLTWVLPIKP